MAGRASALDGLRRFLNKYETLSASLRVGRDDFMVEFLLIKQEVAEWKEQGKLNSFEGAKEVNRKKNRYKDILPYDATRVLLPKGSGDAADYINANYIKGPSDDIEYIASQGPMPATVDDFWKMLWKHKPKVIAMLCKEIELGKHRCQRYWPEDKEELKFGDIKVNLLSDKNIGDNLHLRQLKYSKGKEDHRISQIHYTSWPDHGAPDSSSPILHLIEQMREEQGISKTPIVVHCSAGCGRTGAVIAIDIARKFIERKAPDVNVLEIVKRLRTQRPAMVQTKEQYEYVYNVVNELVERELERSPVDAGPGFPTYVNIQQFRSKGDSIYATARDFTHDDVPEGQFKRTLSLNMRTESAQSNAPQLPKKSPKTERSASSSAILGPDMLRGASLPFDKKGSNHHANRGGGDWSVALVKNSAPKEVGPPQSGKSSDYVVPARNRSAVLTSVGSGAKGSATSEGQSGRPAIAAKPSLAPKVTSTKPLGNSDSSNSPPKVIPSYAPISVGSRPNPADSNYEQIWPWNKQRPTGRDSEAGAPPLPERTPESFVSLSESDSAYSPIDNGDPKGEQSGWFSGKLKKFGNIMSPTRGKLPTGPDSVFYGAEGPLNSEGKSRSLDRKISMATYPAIDLGFGKRLPVKPRGPRQQPNEWPNYVRQQPLGSL